jgi:hypothetical protein
MTLDGTLPVDRPAMGRVIGARRARLRAVQSLI